MNKTELIEAVACRADLSKSKAGEAVDAFIRIVSESLEKGEEVSITGFGTFGIAERQARQGRHPQTGELIEIPAARLPKFKPGKNLKAVIK